jgi:hypothetical protein
MRHIGEVYQLTYIKLWNVMKVIQVHNKICLNLHTVISAQFQYLVSISFVSGRGHVRVM